jgi:hypothetical protein
VHEVVPAFATTDFHQPAPGRFFHQPPSANLHLENQGLEVARQHQVAPATQHEHRVLRRRLLPVGAGHQAKQVIDGTQADKALRTRSDAEGVHRLEGDIVLD